MDQGLNKAHEAKSAPPDDRGSWGVAWAAIAYAGFMASQLFPAIVAVAGYALYSSLLGQPIHGDEAEYPPILLAGAGIVSHILIILMVVALVRVVHGLNFRRAISWDPERPISALEAAGFGIALVIINVALPGLFQPPEDAQIPLKEITESTGGFVIFSAMAIFLAPISEEFLFRGYIFAPLQKRWGSVCAVIVTAVLFMAPHLPQLGDFWQGAVLIGILGLVTGYLRVRTGGVKAASICHLTYNALLVLLEATGRIAPQ